MPADPYLHHPELRGRINDPHNSYFRSFRPADLDAQMQALGYPPTWRFTDAEREANRQTFLGSRLQADLWVFAYGSLIWDPAFLFAEVRKAHVDGYTRSFCLKDTFGMRGSPEAPGLQAALDLGTGCNGLVFRIDAANAPVESEVVWRREAIASGYIPTFVTATTALGPVEALTFVANHADDAIFPDLTRAEQVRYLATGKGRMGSSRDYLENIAAQFAVLGIEDAEVNSLVAEVQAFDQKGLAPAAAQSATTAP